jgi:transcriptional regulator with XRE-family HTH domain
MKEQIDWRAIGHRIRVTRIALDITEQQAAAGFGVGVPTYRRYEAGRPAGNRIADFARHYRVSLDWLIDGEAATIASSLAEKALGKVAILPCTSPQGGRGRRGRSGATGLAPVPPAFRLVQEIWITFAKRSAFTPPTST